VPIRAAYDRHTRELYVTYADAPGLNGQCDGSVHELRTANGKWTEVTPVKPGRNHDGGTAHTLGSGGGSADTFGYGGVAVDARAPAPSWSPRTTRGPTSTTVFRSTNGGRTWTSLKDSAVLNDGGRTWALSGARPAVAKEAPGPIATNAHGSVLLWSLGPANPGYRSADNGATWSEAASFPKGAAPIGDPVDPPRSYAFDTTTGTVFAGTDSGRTFTARATAV
jgi:hypothetical protein